MDEAELRAVDLNQAQATCAYLGTSELGETHESRDLWMWSCGLPASSFNVVFPKAPPRRLDAGLARGEAFFGARDLPWRVNLRHQLLSDAAATLQEAGFAEVGRSPGMVLRELDGPRPAPAGLELRSVASPEELAEFQATAFLGFGLPAELGAKFVTGAFLALPNVRLLVGRISGEPVCTAALVMTGDQIGVYWVATLEAFRGRGLGEAATWAALDAGRALGGRWASLGASELGLPVYRRMGFQVRTEYVSFERPAPR